TWSLFQPIARCNWGSQFAHRATLSPEAWTASERPADAFHFLAPVPSETRPAGGGSVPCDWLTGRDGKDASSIYRHLLKIYPVPFYIYTALCEKQFMHSAARCMCRGSDCRRSAIGTDQKRFTQLRWAGSRRMATPH